MWRELIADLGENAVFNPPASVEEIQDLETRLQMSLPEDFVALLGETNGAEVGFVRIVWSINEIAENNEELRSQVRIGGELQAYMPVDHLFFFGEAGNGDLFAFPIAPEGARNRVFMWNHEDDSRTCQAHSLADWLRGTNGR